jgi:hypothetical protein
VGGWGENNAGNIETNRFKEVCTHCYWYYKFSTVMVVVMIATEEEMESAKLPLADRDFCAHLLLKYRACRADKAPWLWQCGHEKHEYLQCEYEE